MHHAYEYVYLSYKSFSLKLMQVVLVIWRAGCKLKILKYKE